MAQATNPGPGQNITDWDEHMPLNLCRAPAYPYRQLSNNDIRLLNILPGHGTLECTLHQMPLVEEQVYRALSYVWGSSTEMQEILLEGEPFKVTRNLYEALHQLRTEQPGPSLELGHPGDYVWIDSICLNQEDIEEKSHQVPRMMEIYQIASVVLIWLGPNKPITKAEKLHKETMQSSTDPVGFLRHEDISADHIIGLLFEKINSLWIDWRLPDDEAQQDSVLREVFGESYSAVLQAMAHLLQRPWFKRVWTFQECGVARSSWIISGRHGTHLNDFTKMLKVLSRHTRLLLMAPGFARIRALVLIEDLQFPLIFNNKKLEMNIAQCFLQLLSYSSGLQATNPRDHLYGLLGFVTYFTGKHLPKELMPNYRLPFETVYWQYAAYLLENAGDLGLLMTDHHKLQGVPSWVPDFRGLANRKDAECEPIVSISQDKETLCIQGIRMEPICDTVCEWYNPRFSGATDTIHPDLHHHIRYVEGRIFKLASQIRNVTLEEILDDFLWEACRLFDQGGTEGMRKAYTDLKGHFGRNGAWIPRREKAKTSDAFGKNFLIADEIRLSLVLLDDGTILSVSRTAVEILPDDVVCLFKGALIPVIIRPSGQYGSFVLISHCKIRSGTFFRRLFDDDFWVNKSLEEFRLI
ncbi:heterokaryon incompatibility protein-domain-containing protein [Hypoxylon argillaceum]|nr:heterokaryon incompatibility protein-domain-containing protein [Hypoxylon argillaceum]